MVFHEQGLVIAFTVTVPCHSLYIDLKKRNFGEAWNQMDKLSSRQKAGRQTNNQTNRKRQRNQGTNRQREKETNIDKQKNRQTQASDNL